MFPTLLRANLISLGVIAVMSLPADAFTKVKVGVRTKEYIKDLCKSPGRTYKEGQGQYGCMSNCGDTKKASDACGLNCDEKTNECYGWSPGTEKQPTTPAEALKPLPAKDTSGKDKSSKDKSGK